MQKSSSSVKFVVTPIFNAMTSPKMFQRFLFCIDVYIQAVYITEGCCQKIKSNIKAYMVLANSTFKTETS